MSKKGGWLRGASVGPHFVVAPLIGYYLGHKMDQWTGNQKLFGLIGAGLGVASGFLNLFRELAIINKEEQDLLEDSSETEAKDSQNT